MRFCVQCGNGLNPGPAAAPAAVAAPAAAAPPPAQPVVAPQPAPAAAPQAAPMAGTGTACWRCRGVGDPGAEFCKFCGAGYADAPAGANGAAGPQRSPLEPESTAPAKSVERPPGDAAPEAPRGFATVMEAGPQPTHAGARLVAILKDGSDGRVYPLTTTQTQIDIGSREGDVILGDDPYLSPRHARIARADGGWTLRDLDSVNGVYMRLKDVEVLTDGDRILIGQQVLRFEVLADGELPLGPASLEGVLVFGTPEVPRIARLLQYTTEGVGRDVHYLYRDETVLGRENGDIVFTDDPFLSRRHAAITVDRAAMRFALRDLGSSNGTALRFRGERKLVPGDQFRVGRHLFRFDEGERGGQGG